MMAGAMSWRKALKFSCMIHLCMITIIGAVLAGWAQPAEQERYIAVELAAPFGEAYDGGQPSAIARQEENLVPVAQDAPTRSAFTSTNETPSARANAALQSAGAKIVGDGRGIAEVLAQVRGDGSTSAVEGAATGREQVAAHVDKAATIDGFLARVEANKKYPYMALKRSLEGRPVIYTELDAAGNLVALSLSASSGTESLDKAALAAVRNACPYRHGLGTVLAMEVPVNYQLTGG